MPGWRGIREGFLEEAVNKQSLRNEQELPGEKKEELFIQMKPAHGCLEQLHSSWPKPGRNQEVLW